MKKRADKKMKCLSIVVVCLTVLLAGHAMAETSETEKQDNVESLIGYYALPSPLCNSQYIGDCEKSIDCLKIDRKDSEQYQVELYSVQAHQQLCAFEIAMNADNSTLRYQDEKGREISLTIDGTNLLFHTNGFSPSPGFCGAHAAINGLAFPLTSKQPLEGKTCFEN